MTDPDEVVANAHTSYAEVVERLRQKPLFRAVMADYSAAPHVVFQCPHRHRLLEITIGPPPLQSPPSDYPRILPAGDHVPVDVVTDGWDDLFTPGGKARPATFGDDRLRFKCPRCPYNRVWRQEQLLEFYNEALEGEKRTIRLK
jgi:hypothetical protein